MEGEFSTKAAVNIELTAPQFDSFVSACLDTESKPSQEILEAARLLDTEGVNTGTKNENQNSGH